MKKNMIVLGCVLCAFTLFSCQKEENNPQETIPAGTVEDDVPAGYSKLTLSAVSDDTKTTLDGTTVKWKTEDQIKVYCSDGTASDFTLVGEGGSATGSFAGSVPSGETALYAIYPNDLYSSVSEATVNVTIPATQDGVFGNANIAVAKVEAETMAFKNVNAFIGFTLPAGITKVVVSSVGDSGNLSGTLAVDCSGETPVAGSLSDAGTSITATFPESTGGTYYVAVAPGITHSKGLLLEWYKGSAVSGTYWLNKAITTAAGSVYDMGSVSAEGDYYVSVDGSGSKSGMNWANAWSAAQLWAKLHPAGSDADIDGAKLAHIDGATFHLAAGTYNWGSGAEINIDESETVSFTFMGESGTIFTGDDDNDGTGDHRILALGGNMNVTFNGIGFENGKVADGNGGALNIDGGQWKFSDCTFSGNEASGNGGAMNLSDGVATIYKSTFSGNEAGGNGGAINVAEGATIEMYKAASNTQFTSNVASGCGGAVNIESKNGDLELDSEAPTNRINYVDFKRNSAHYGGAVAVCGESGKTSRVIFGNCTMGSTSSSDANYATVDGGAIYFEGECFVNLGNSTIRRNYATEKGGSICVVGWGMLQLYRCYFHRNYAKTGGVVYTEGADSKCADFFVDECSFEANYITVHYGCVFNINGINQFSMYNSSAKDSYTTATGSSDKKNLCPSWIAIDGVQAGGCVSMANCSIIGDTWDGKNNAALTNGTALIAIWGSQTNYFTNCIIVPETVGSIAAIRGDGSEVVDLYYTHYSNVGNIGTNTDSGGNTTGRISTDFGSLSWASNCWQWNGQIDSSAPSLANQSGVYNRVNTICPDFVTWCGSDFNKDQRGAGRGNGDWWPGAYQGNN